MKRNWLAFFIIILSIGLWARENPDSTKIIIGGDSDYRPYEFINSKGEPDGYCVELSREVAKLLGKEPVFRLGKWSLVMEHLDMSEIDVLQGMAFSIERARNYYFSSPHAETWRAIFSRKDSDISSEKDILNRSVVIQQGDVASEYL